ncbi:MAG: hypothetical protein EA356_17605 [Geminicoccaceae bacterium]|nr:MAG: hypothetical protein EA356_17605 [Geminicoccaceae bacterium]
MTGGKAKQEAVAVFEEVVDLDEAVQALLDAGFEEADLSLLADRATVERKLGHTYAKVDDLVDEPATPRLAYRRPADPAANEGRMIGSLTWAPPLIAAGGVVASTGIVTGLVIGAAVAGTLAASVLGHVIDRRHADWLQEQLDAGGILLWVQLKDEDMAAAALSILTRHAAHDVHVHDIPHGG